MPSYRDIPNILYREKTVKPGRGYGAVQLLVRIPRLNELFLSISLQGLINFLSNLVDCQLFTTSLESDLFYCLGGNSHDQERSDVIVSVVI